MGIESEYPEIYSLPVNKRLAEKLDKVYRWHGSIQLPEGHESDLNHTDSMVTIAQGILERYPVIGEFINRDTLMKTIILHDVAEVFVGDAPQEMNSEQRKHHDIQEEQKGRMLLRDPELKAMFSSMFELPDDQLEPLLCKYIDKMQAGLFLMHEMARYHPTSKIKKELEMYEIPGETKYGDKIEKLLCGEAKDNFQELRQVYSAYISNPHIYGNVDRSVPAKANTRVKGERPANGSPAHREPGEAE